MARAKLPAHLWPEASFGEAASSWGDNSCASGETFRCLRSTWSTRALVRRMASRNRESHIIISTPLVASDSVDRLGSGSAETSNVVPPATNAEQASTKCFVGGHPRHGVFTPPSKPCMSDQTQGSRPNAATCSTGTGSTALLSARALPPAGHRATRRKGVRESMQILLTPSQPPPACQRCSMRSSTRVKEVEHSLWLRPYLTNMVTANAQTACKTLRAMQS